MRLKLQAQFVGRQVFWLGLAAAVIGALYVQGGENFAGALVLAGAIVFAIGFVRSATSIGWRRHHNRASFVDAAYLELAKSLISAALAIDLIVGPFYLARYGVLDEHNDAVEAVWLVLFFLFGGMSIIFFACFLGTLAFIFVNRR
jgi:hypothetical protein